MKMITKVSMDDKEYDFFILYYLVFFLIEKKTLRKSQKAKYFNFFYSIKSFKILKTIYISVKNQKTNVI